MKYIALSLTFLFFAIKFCLAQPGVLDQSFGDGGKIISQGTSSSSSTLQKDGKILLAGTGFDAFTMGFLATRYKPNGILDSSFGINGRRAVSIGLENSSAALVIQKDDKIIIAGTTSTDYFNTIEGPRQNVNFALCRYLSNGDVDSSFGENGKIITDLGGYEYAYDMVLQPDGKIIVGGTIADAKNPDGPFHFLLVRYLPDGEFDASFGDDGKVITVLNSFNTDLLNALALQPDGKILAAGSTKFIPGSFTTEKFAIVRYYANGYFDSTFGVNGIIITDFGSKEEVIKDVQLQKDGKIVAVGTSFTSIFNSNMAVVRYNTDGTIDKGFGTEGKVALKFDEGASQGSSVILQQDEKIIIGGSIATQTFEDFALARCNNDGSIDSSFGTNGKTVSDFETNEYANTSLLQKDGKILLTGTSTNAETNGYVISRYLGDPIKPRPSIAQIKRWIRNHILHFEDANTNAAYYVIEKSTASNTGFVPVTKITANATSINYSYTLPEAATQSTYRIKAVNKDNSITYSSPISSSDPAKAGVASFKVYPNPAKDRITVESVGTVQLRLQNSNGRVLLTQTVNGKGSIDISKLPNGIYYVVNTVNGESLKVVKE